MNRDVSSDRVRQARMTVVIPVYNRAERVMSTLRSLEAQTLRPLDIVLVDNNSNDDTAVTLSRWQSQVVTDDFRVKIVCEKTPGAAAARNRGLDEVITPLTMFFDSDDLMTPGHCKRVVEAFESHPEADIIGWDCMTVFPDGSTRKVIFADRDLLWNDVFQGAMATQRYVARTVIFREAGGWNAGCMGWNDIELGLRILLRKPRVVKLGGDITVNIIHTADSITGASFSAKSAVWEHTLDVMEESADRAGDIRLKRYLNFRRAILAGDYRREGATDRSHRLMAEVMKKEKKPCYRMLYRLAVRYRGASLPGISKLLRPLF